jgi:HAD superfamily hydrolase (TIGR01509 family)
MGQIRGVILDVDGTLVDSNDAHARAWVDALAEFGHQVPYERVRPLIGMGGDKVLPLLVGLSAGEGKGKQIAERREEIFASRYLPQVRPLPGARELLARMKQEGLKLAVASSSREDMLRKLLALVGAEDVLDAATSSDDAEKSKPDPDIVKAALRRLGERPEHVVMIGDTPYDIQAAARAGIRTIAFRSGGWSHAELSGALAIYDGPEDLLRRFDKSVLAGAAVETRRRGP